jgi:hypothetical protein
MPDASESDETVARGEFTASDHMSVTNMMGVHGLELLSTMLAAGGSNANASAIAATAATLRSNIVAKMWNGTAFCDGICTEVGGNSRLFSNVYSLAYGLVPEANVDSVWTGVNEWGLQSIGDYGAFWWQMAITSGYYSGMSPYETPDDGTAIVTCVNHARRRSIVDHTRRRSTRAPCLLT